MCACRANIESLSPPVCAIGNEEELIRGLFQSCRSYSPHSSPETKTKWHQSPTRTSAWGKWPHTWASVYFACVLYTCVCPFKTLFCKLAGLITLCLDLKKGISVFNTIAGVLQTISLLSCILLECRRPRHRQMSDETFNITLKAVKRARTQRSTLIQLWWNGQHPVVSEDGQSITSDGKLVPRKATIPAIVNKAVENYT